MLDHEEAVQQFEGHRRHGEEVEGHNYFAVIVEKRQPPFPRIAPPMDASQIASDGPLGNHEAEFL